ncbi:ankyrin repeat and SAM domain-containing protein 6-like isoform X2 [Uranotaenia lowii]|uniref:ankyrin repeat and SAM domain-containing protein 6-like isoform X2 n=1 Tax=Uranotaenia lowii TaxID=190385 RepID=UPI002479428C|nr:ankyrin repeat and SAM domain-containing protein 6-like isoform X2 [Uranotaenia lowii]
MSRDKESKTAHRPSPKIFRLSPNSLEVQDISFEAYKQARLSSDRRRSFSPNLNNRNMISPDISPIALNKNFGMAPRTNTPRVKPPAKGLSAMDYPKFKMPPQLSNGDRRKTFHTIGTPLAKRQLEHRISVSNILLDMDLGKYARIFSEEEIDFEVFLTLSEKDLHDIGIHCKEDIELIVAKVAEYNACV